MSSYPNNITARRERYPGKDDAMDLTTEQKLDTLAEYHSQKDSLEAKKRALLDEIKVPAEVLEVQRLANEESQKFSAAQYKKVEALRDECAAKLAEIVIPEDVRKIIDEIDHQRGLVQLYQNEKERELMAAAEQKRTELFNKSQYETAKVYADLAQRKADIEAEFANDAASVDANIKALEAEIKNDVKNGKKSVKGKYFQAVYVSGRITWNTDKMEAWIVDHPFLRDARKEGEPSVTLRKV
jgi:hypothetical protein